MLLRRITEHVKAQNWTAVMLDFVIVVVGVFMGIQVSNWNDDRRLSIEERRVILQLLGEVEPAIDLKESWLERTQPRLESLQSAIKIIQSTNDESTLSDAECRAVALSHIVLFRSSTLPTLEEIRSTGGLGTISNPKARIALMRYKAGLNEVDAVFEFIRDDFANLIDGYGEYFPRAFTDGEDRDDFPVASEVKCRLDRIREEQSLKNKMVSNLARTQSLINQVHIELKLLHEVEAALNESVL